MMNVHEILPQLSLKTTRDNLMESEDLLDQKLFKIATTGGFDVLARQAIADYKAGKTVEI